MTAPPAGVASAAAARGDAAVRVPDAVRVALWRGHDRAGTVRAVLELVVGAVDWRSRRHVVVKPNIVDPRRPLAVTHRDALAAVLAAIRERYDGALDVAEGCAVCPTGEAFARLGYAEVCRVHGAGLVDLNADATVPATVFDRRGRPLRLRLARTMVDSDCRVSLGVPKTHDTVLVTLAIKNAVMGALVDRRRVPGAPGRPRGMLPAVGARGAAFVGRVRAAALGHGDGRGSDKVAMHQGYPTIHLNLALLAPRVLPHLAVLDGWEAMEGAGPSDGTAVPWHVALAGTNALAVDALAARLMGFDPREVGYIAYCARLGLGPLDLPPGALAGNIAPETVRRRFVPHPRHEEQCRWHSPDADDRLAAARTPAEGDVP